MNIQSRLRKLEASRHERFIPWVRVVIDEGDDKQTAMAKAKREAGYRDADEVNYITRIIVDPS